VEDNDRVDREDDVVLPGTPELEVDGAGVVVPAELVLENVGGGLVEPNSPPLESLVEERDETDEEEVEVLTAELAVPCDVDVPLEV